MPSPVANDIMGVARQASADPSSGLSVSPTSSLSNVFARNEFPLDVGAPRWLDLLSSCNGTPSIRPRQTLYRAGEVLPGIPVISDGWASRICRLPDGRRQILSFILPGDLVSAHAAFRDRLTFSVESITAVRHTYFDRTEFCERLAAEPKLLSSLVSTCLAEKEEVDQLATSLGRRRADERIAHMILYLMERLSARGMVRDQSFIFPLRQQHIADVSGLTSVHVNRVIGAMRNEGLIELNNSVLKIINLAGLQRIAA